MWSNYSMEQIQVAATPTSPTNILLQGDARHLVPTLTYDYLFTSPPDFDEVGTRVALADYQAFLYEFFSLFQPRLGILSVAFTDRKHQSAVIPKHIALYNALTALGYTLRSHKIWMKSNKANLYRLAYGNVMTFSTGKWHAARSHNAKDFAPDIWNVGYGKYKDYTFGMPVSVPSRCILHYTSPCDIVCDPFMGSGTTAVAAIQINRRYVGTELDLESYKLAQQRILECTT